MFNAAQRIKALLATLNPDAVFFDGRDSAIVGLGSQYPKPPVVVYSESKIVKELEKDMDPEEAEEWYAHNIMCLGLGDNTPVIMAEEWAVLESEVSLEDKEWTCIQANLN